MNVNALLQLHFEGPSVKNGSILWEDLAQFISNFDSAIQRVINVSETGKGIRRGRPTRAFQALTALEITSVTPTGSVEVKANLRRDDQLLPGFDIAEDALIKLTGGLEIIAHDGEDIVLPEGFDQGVLTALREAGRIFDRGFDNVHILANDFRPKTKTTYSKSVRERIISKILKLEQGWAQIEGRLLMVELKEGNLRCRLNPSADAPILCSFDEDTIPAIVNNLRTFVRIRGEATVDPVTQRIHSVFVRDIEAIEEPELSISLPVLSTFWRPKSFDELAAEQGIYPLEDWDTLGGNWPEGADFDSFLEAIRSA